MLTESLAHDECGDLFSYKLLRADGTLALSLYNFNSQPWNWTVGQNGETLASGTVTGFDAALETAVESLKEHLPADYRQYAYLKLQKARGRWREARDAMAAAHEAFNQAQRDWEEAEKDLANA